MPKWEIQRSIYLVISDDDVITNDYLHQGILQLGELHGGEAEVFSGIVGEVEIKDFLSLSGHVPMFYSSSIVVLKSVQDLKAEEIQLVVEALDSVEEGNHVLLTSTSVPKKALHDYLKSNAVIFEKKLANDKERGAYAMDLLRDSNMRLSPEARSALLVSVGSDVSKVQGVLSVLEASFAPGLVVDEQDIEPYLHNDGDVPPWKLTDLIQNGDMAGSLKLLHRMMVDLNKPAQLITSSLARYFMELAAISSPTLKTAESMNSALEASGLKGKNPYAVLNLHKVATKLGSREFQTVFSYLGSTERGLRGESATSDLLQMELLVARCVSLIRITASNKKAHHR